MCMRSNFFLLAIIISIPFLIAGASAASLNLNMGGSFKFADSFLDTMVSCSGGKGATQLNWNEYYQNDNTQERIISGTSAGKEYQEIQYKETWVPDLARIILAPIWSILTAVVIGGCEYAFMT